MNNDLKKDFECKTIFADKLINFLEISKEYIDFLDSINFVLEDLGYVYNDKDIIEISKYYYSYTDIGIKNKVIEGKINNNLSVNLYPIDNSISSNDEMYNEYEGQININNQNFLMDNNKYCCMGIYELDLKVYIENLVITIEGTIGCRPFRANYKYSGFISL